MAKWRGLGVWLIDSYKNSVVKFPLKIIKELRHYDFNEIVFQELPAKKKKTDNERNFIYEKLNNKKKFTLFV